MNKDVIIALDFASRERVFDFLDKFKEKRPYVKVGMELYYGEGPEIVREVKARGHKVFLDLKLCDIPNTVKSAMKIIGGLGVDMTNVHIYGGKTMMAWAVEGLESSGKKKPLLLGITQLTSTSQKQLNEEILIQGNINDVIVEYAKKIGAEALIRGIRNVADFSYEFDLALLNRGLNKEIETLFLPPDPSYFVLRSSSIRELASLGGDLSSMVPPLVEEKLKEKVALNYL